MFPRLSNPPESSSFFLFGPRGTGKSTFLEQHFAQDRTLWIDLLDPEQEDIYARRPKELSERISAQKGRFDWVVIDEIQKVPRLLSVVHESIERTGTRFALTGSSARKLRRGSADMLSGRAFVEHMFPLTSREMGDAFDLQSALETGTLPGLTRLESREDRLAFLRAYALTYLKEEVWSEQVVRKLDPFRLFLEVAAQCNGEIVNTSGIARDVGADHKTVGAYFEILEDTLVGLLLEPCHASVRKRQARSPKFYFFDTGVTRALSHTLNVPLVPRTHAFGKAFEQLVILEIARLNSYGRRDYRLSYLRTKDGAEIDLVVERPGMPAALVEIKSTDHADERDVRGLRRFLPDFPGAEAFCLSRDDAARVIDGVPVLPWLDGIAALGL